MKYFLFIFFTICCSSLSAQNYYYTLEGQQSQPSLKPPPKERNTENLLLTETFENNQLGFDPGLSDFYAEFAADHSLIIVEDIKRAGNSAGRFEINKDDPLIWEETRAEFSQAWRTARPEGWYGFSFYFPDTYISDSSGEIIVQWHDHPDDGEAVNRSPSNALIASDGKLKWMVRWDADRIMEDGFSDGTIYIDLGEIPKNQWIDWVVHIKYSHTNTGILEVWMDGEQVINRQNKPNAYNDASFPYLKFGLYKWSWEPEPSKKVVYFDEVRVGNENSSFDEVKPSD